ncbi:peptide-methionine (S)-S-oxide reductase MsrA [Vibrio anguillarum]|jgi:peptide-methionine (S)-S-oxide reductase|uniref:Peptide methionine sulfoxide reductase MsrA n=3 Tax=Vibrio anguillarum TaxID=55601 RepID=A0AAW4BDU1_VIBAN|nr:MULTISPECIES: peptide-methionine (S)-S-oxide reductase MsrA [Vibrio]AQM18730.1 peptide-methionine (S)-S-oxide reductase [Vibrio anguillarum]AQP35278.1 peptide-methionine (S)-S-oxide reductase [Vibrio anguillarum]ASG00747.1 peptide-methionine (S)-S-oxide reductase [Vibrio anguillarum]ASO30051.1 peptide-methionine (S)-S-oxide reductase [Vibrio anguillarum]AUB86834.1 peptide-methionine (S)-S-oxide reductase MsrA [Vibrio anguillarum]
MLNKQTMVSAQTALKGRETPMSVEEIHYVNHSNITEQPNEHQQQIVIGMGCFWGAERLFWQLDGVVSTSVGYAGGFTPNPTYEEVCSGETGHTEVVRVIFDPQRLPLEKLLSHFWEKHDPTQGMRQGNDKGTQYRSAIYTYSEQQQQIAQASKQRYQQALSASQRALITTEIAPAGPYYYAESYHQQYLAKNPNGYCGLGGTGICFPPQLSE